MGEVQRVKASGFVPLESEHSKVELGSLAEKPNVGVAFTPSWTTDGKGVIALRIKHQQGQLVYLPLSPSGEARSITKRQAVEGAWGAMSPAVSTRGKVAFTDDRVQGGGDSVSRLAVVGVLLRLRMMRAALRIKMMWSTQREAR